MGIGSSFRHATHSVTHSVGKAVHGVAHDKWVRAGVGYFTGWGEWQAIQAGYSYLRGAKDAKQYYDLTTGHYQRQIKREEQAEQQRQERMLKQQQEYAYNQRKKQIDELRERVGAGGTRYRTNMQDRKMATSLFGGNGNVETLG